MMQTSEIIRQDDTSTVIRILAFPFGDSKNVDLHGEFVDANTDFGDEYGVNRKFAFYDHGKSHYMNDVMAEHRDKQLVGVAEYAKTDEWGRWFDIEVQRSKEYHDYLIELQKRGLLGASSSTFASPSAKMMDPEIEGRIARWLDAEVSLTVTPANYKTVQEWHNVAKSFDMPFAEDIEKVLKTFDDLEKTEDMTNDEFKNAVTDALDGKVKDDQEQLDDKQEEIQTEEETETVDETSASDIQSLQAEVTALKSTVGTLVAFFGLDQEGATEKTFKDAFDTERIDKSFNDMRGVMLQLAKEIGSLKTTKGASEAEQAAMTQPQPTKRRQSGSAVPEHAPGS
jgi:polyhydroxyalkanoate synthesis regulator phasin